MIASRTYVKQVMGDKPAKKKYGQNFLIDHNTVEKIARIAADEDLLSIEIGPGLGALSEELLRYSRAVEAYEIDKDMYDLLKQGIRDERFRVYQEDFLKCDLSKYKEKVNVCGNLPYYVTTPILFHIFESPLPVNRITVMVQKEVGDRICAPVGSEDYAALSIIVQYLYEVKQVMNVPKTVFYPQPKVDSAVITFTPKTIRNKAYEEQLFTLIRNSFRMRRKTLYNNLKDLYPQDELKQLYEKLKLPENVRAQQLSLADFEMICQELQS